MKLKSTITAGFLASILSTAYAGSIAYQESTMGDFSNSGASPTAVPISLGSNQVFGTTGRGSSGLDRDYFTITVPSGLLLSSITVLPGTTSGGAVSFIGMEPGPQVTLPTNPPDATGLLGWWHYSPADISTDILPKMGSAGNGSTGFTPPLPSGSYSFWVQDFNAGTFSYGFDFGVTAAAVPAPEPGTMALVFAAALGLAGIRRVRRPHVH